MAAVPASAAAAASDRVVLASAQAWVPRPAPPSPALSGRDARRLLRLQLSAAPGPERFRLGLRGGPDSGPEPSLVEYSLKEISYEVKSTTCHELKVLNRPDDPLVFHFEDEQEAQKWWMVVSSSLRDVHKAPEGTNGLPGQSSPQPLAAVTCLPLELLKKEDLALRLSAAIELGDEETAVRCTALLAQQHTTLRIRLKESSYPASQISMKVQVEDATCSASITTRVHTHTTVGTLRQQVFQDYGFHPSVQRWIIGRCLCVEERTVGSYGIQKDGDTAFLYLLSAKGANLSEQRYKEDKDWGVLHPAPSPLLEGSDARRKGGPSSSPLPKTGVKDLSRKMDVEEITRFLDSVKLGQIPPGRAHTPATVAAAPSSPVQAGWSCPTCTFINKPTRPGCEMCSTDRPASYLVPGTYRPDELELWRMQQEKEGILQYQKEKGRREDRPAGPCAHSLGPLDDFIHLSSEFS